MNIAIMTANTMLAHTATRIAHNNIMANQRRIMQQHAEMINRRNRQRLIEQQQQRREYRKRIIEQKKQNTRTNFLIKQHNMNEFIQLDVITKYITEDNNGNTTPVIRQVTVNTFLIESFWINKYFEPNESWKNQATKRTSKQYEYIVTWCGDNHKVTKESYEKIEQLFCSEK